MKNALHFKLPEMPHAVLACIQLLLVLLFAPMAFSQDDQNLPPQPEFSQQELDQMLAPIALYPDALLSQVLMASTYPLEVVQAARWSRANPGLKGDQAVKAAERNNWDPSVISLTAFPQILAMMDEKLDWTERLGDAFLAQQPQVMDTVQDLRHKASTAGNLQSNDQIRVEPQGQTIIIEQAAPEIVYVPYYDPFVVYGPWWWDAYPPVYWAPWPGYYARPGYSIGFFWGSGIFVSGGFFFGGCDWHQHRVNIVNVNNYYYNSYYANPRHSNPYTQDWGSRNRPSGDVRNPTSTSGSEHEWRHDPGHRRGVPYREPALQQQFGRANLNSGAQRNFQGRNQSPRRTDGQPQARPETGIRSGNDTAPRNHSEPQMDGRMPDSNPAEHGNKTGRPDSRYRPDNGARQRNVAPANQTGGSEAAPDAMGTESRDINRSDKSTRPNRSDSSHTEIRSNSPSAPAGTTRPVITRTPDTSPPVIQAPEPSGHSMGNESRGYDRQQPQAGARNGGAVPERAAPVQRPNANAEPRPRDNNHNGSNRSNQDNHEGQDDSGRH